jgi:hypothetical protein
MTTMKNGLFIVLLLIVAVSCKKDDEPDNYFSLKINGKQTEYHYYRAIENYYRKGFTLIIAGDSADLFVKANEQFGILVKIENKKVFNLNDSLVASYEKRDAYLVFSAPRVYFDFSLLNLNQDSIMFDRVSTDFNLVINSYDTFNKSISGYFNGILRNPDKTDSVIITDGRFKVALEFNTSH